MSSAERSSVLRSLVVVGTTYTAVLVATAATHASAHLCGPSGDGSSLNGCVEKETENEKRSLRVASYGMFRDLKEVPLPEENHWHPVHDRRDPIDYSHKSMHVHNRHDYYNDRGRESDDEYDSEDENSDDKKDDDEKDDDEKDDDDENDKNDSSRSASGKSQSSVLMNLDGVNIGNTITIVNMGNASQQSGNIGPSNNKPNGNVWSSNDTSAATRAFCDSIGCSSLQGSPSTNSNLSYTILPTTPSVAGSNATRDNDVRCGIPAISNDSSRVTKPLAQWLLLIAILVELCR